MGVYVPLLRTQICEVYTCIFKFTSIQTSLKSFENTHLTYETDCFIVCIITPKVGLPSFSVAINKTAKNIIVFGPILGLGSFLSTYS